VAFIKALPDDRHEIFFDPQTSGGLLMAVPAAQLGAMEHALDSRGVPHWVIGEVIHAATSEHRRPGIDGPHISIV
ncbi:MAG TPA: hypothetical protein VF396_23370, partial [Bradyrhizobium sp.]